MRASQAVWPRPPSPLYTCFTLIPACCLACQRLTDQRCRFAFRCIFVSSLVQIFDPLGLSDGAEPGEIKLWREAEIKHGRVAMLASLGVLVAEVRNLKNNAQRMQEKDRIALAVIFFHLRTVHIPEMVRYRIITIIAAAAAKSLCCLSVRYTVDIFMLSPASMLETRSLLPVVFTWLEKFEKLRGGFSGQEQKPRCGAFRNHDTIRFSPAIVFVFTTIARTFCSWVSTHRKHGSISSPSIIANRPRRARQHPGRARYSPCALSDHLSISRHVHDPAQKPNTRKTRAHSLCD